MTNNKISPDKIYLVRLAKPVKVGAVEIDPFGEKSIKGSFLQKIIDENGEDSIDTMVAQK